ncbi:hypothetical protein ACFLQW_00515 [Candidatus Zixiibacteriota bacterium]
MKNPMRLMGPLPFGGLALLVLLLAVASPSPAELTYEQQQLIWRDFTATTDVFNIGFNSLQELAGDKETEKWLGDYGNMVLLMKIEQKITQEGDLHGAMKLIESKLTDMMVKKLVPNFHKWLGWIGLAKTAMQLINDFVFDPMVAEMSVSQYISARDDGLDMESAYAVTHGYGALIVRAKKEYRRQHGDAIFEPISGDLTPAWRDKFYKWLNGRLEMEYHKVLLDRMKWEMAAAAVEAEGELRALREQLRRELQNHVVEKIVLRPSTAELRPGEQVTFDATAVYKYKSAPRSADDVTGAATWSGGTADNVFLATSEHVGRKITITAEYAQLIGSATITVTEIDCGDFGVWNPDDQICDCDSGYVYDVDLVECVSTEPVEAAEVLERFEGPFYDAVELFDRHQQNFMSRLQSYAGVSAHEICADDELAFSYVQALAAAEEVDAIYYLALEEVTGKSYGQQITESLIGTERSGLWADELAAMDQLRLRLFRKDHARVQGEAEGLPDQLAQFAPGCDPEELIAEGERTTEEDQDAETGVTGTGDIPTGDGDGNGGGNGDGAGYWVGGSTGTDDKEFGSCSGGSLRLTAISYSFPERIYPDQPFVVEVYMRWTISGSNIYEVAIGTVAISPVDFNNLQELRPTASGSHTFRFTLNQAGNMYPNLGSFQIRIIVSGGIICDDGGGVDDARLVYYQEYHKP